jgi:hypothetical protein
MFENMFKSILHQCTNSKNTIRVYQKYYPISRNVQNPVLGKKYREGIAKVYTAKNLNIDACFINNFSINENIRSERSLRLKWKHYNTILEPWQQTRHTREKFNQIKYKKWNNY